MKHVSDAIGDRSGFTRSCSGKDQKRSFNRLGSYTLFGIKTIEGKHASESKKEGGKCQNQKTKKTLLCTIKPTRKYLYLRHYEILDYICTSLCQWAYSFWAYRWGLSSG